MLRRILVIGAAVLIFVPFLAVAQEDTAKAPAAYEKEEPKEEAAAETPGLMVEAEVCTGIEDRMPVGTADTFPPQVERLYLWSKVIGAQDSISIHHVWSYEGEEKLDVELPVKSPSWRTWTYKAILPEWTGKWEAKIIGPDGTVMATIPFTVTEQSETE